MDAQRLLALSDTHGHVSALEAVLKWVQTHDTVDAAVFLGDGLQDLRRAAPAAGFSGEWTTVRGNNDYEFSTPEAACLNFGGHRFFLCHGHRYALYSGYDTLIAAARNMEADAALFGHAHVPSFVNVPGLVLINPGSIGRPRSRIGASFAIIACSPDKPLDVQFWGLSPRGDIKEIKVS